MIPERIWSEIESPLFGATLGVVSTPRAFDDALLQNRTVRELLALATTEDEALAVSRRVTNLIGEQSNPRYCHQRDLPIGVYLRILDIAAPDVALGPATLALRVPNLWWGMVMARRISSTPNRAATFHRMVAPLTHNGVVWISNNRTSTPSLPPSEVHIPASYPAAKVHVDTTAGSRWKSVEEGSHLHVSSINVAAA